MFKKIIVSVLIVSSLAVGLSVFAETEGNNNNSAAMASCVAPAIAIRESAIQSAFSTFSTAMSGALTARASDLAAAWQATDKTSRNKAIKAAWSKFRTSSRTARQAHNTAVKSAWSAFERARKACKAPSTGESSQGDNL